jgi:subtilisin family serine protease
LLAASVQSAHLDAGLKSLLPDDGTRPKPTLAQVRSDLSRALGSAFGEQLDQLVAASKDFVAQNRAAIEADLKLRPRASSVRTGFGAAGRKRGKSVKEQEQALASEEQEEPERVLVTCSLVSVRTDLSSIELLRTTSTAQRGVHVSFSIRVDQVADLAAVSEFSSCRRDIVRANAVTVPPRGAVISQADRAMRADEVRARFGATGKNKKIGIISDSFDCLGGMADDIRNGDLPANTVILEELFGCRSGIDEGRGMAQLVHDVAPDSAIVFCSAFNGFVQFADCIIKLADAGCDVIVDDISYFQEAVFQEDLLSQAVNQVAARGIAYFSSAGNSARDSWEGPFAPQRDEAGTLLIDLPILGQGTEGTYRVHSWDGVGDDADADPSSPAVILPQFWFFGSFAAFFLQWDEPFISDFVPDQIEDRLPRGVVEMCTLALAIDFNPQIDADFETFICAEGFNFGFNVDPSLITFGESDSAVLLTLTFVLSRVDTRVPERMKLSYNSDARGPFFPRDFARVILSEDAFEDALPFLDLFAGRDSRSGTVSGHANAAGAIAVGAVEYRDITADNGKPLIEPFSSAGGVPILFDLETRLATPLVRAKPDLSCIDGTDTTFFSGRDSDGNGFPNFFGTSAAAPNAAAIALLMLEVNPTLTGEEIRALLIGSAIDMDTFGFDFNTGHGLCDALGAVQLASSLRASTVAEALGEELTFCLNGGQLSRGTCNAAKRTVITATGKQRVSIQTNLIFRRVHERDGCGLRVSLLVDERIVWKGDVERREQGSVNAVALVDLEDGTHIARLNVQLEHCDGVKFVLGDEVIVATKVGDIQNIEIDGEGSRVIEGSSSSSSSSDS